MARATRRSRTKKKTVSLDFSNVGKAFEAGNEYAVKVVECTLEDGQKAPYFNLKLAGVEDDYQNSYMYHRASTSETSLWRLRPMLEAFGMEIPDGPMDIDPDDLVGRVAMVHTVVETYDGGSSIRPSEFFPADPDVIGEDEDEEDEEEEEKPTRKSRRSRKAKAEEPEEDEDDEDEEEEKPKRRSRRSKKSDDDDEEEPAPKTRRSRKAKKPAGVSADEVDEMNEDELEDLIDQHELDVDLGDHRTLRKKRGAVKDALEEADLLEE